MNKSLSAYNLSYRYPGSVTDVLSGIDLTVQTGEVLTLLGPNGTGKSTLLKCLAGLLPPSSGEVILDMKNLLTMQPHERARKLGFVPQSQVSPFPYLVKDIVIMGRASHLGLMKTPGIVDEEIAYETLKIVGIEHLSMRPCNQVSGGEWQLVLIARAIAQKPKYILLDEPTSHLDLANQMKVLKVVDRLKREGLTIIIATHFPDHAFIISDRVAMIRDQKIQQYGTPEQVITEENLQLVYGIPVNVIRLSCPDRTICVPLWT